jgi:hypothetical protein
MKKGTIVEELATRQLLFSIEVTDRITQLNVE